LRELIKDFFLLIFGQYDKFYWNEARERNYNLLSQGQYNCIIANDIDTLPLAVRLAGKNNSKVVFDAHEYYPDYGQNLSLRDWLHRRLVNYQCETFLKKCDLMLTVSPGIRDLYKENFGVDSKLFLNTKQFHDLEPSALESNQIDLVHHGLALPGRKLELMIKLMEFLDVKFKLHLYLMPHETHLNYFRKIKRMCKQKKNRIRFHDPVPTDRIIEEINQYDIGIFLLPPTNSNYRFALPNKFFEFIQARLAIVIGPSQDMGNYVAKYNIGLVSPDFNIKNLAETLNQLDEKKIMEFKSNSNRFAKVLSLETNGDDLLKDIAALLE
jgi:hypothetical protein